MTSCRVRCECGAPPMNFVNSTIIRGRTYRRGSQHGRFCSGWRRRRRTFLDWCAGIRRRRRGQGWRGRSLRWHPYGRNVNHFGSDERERRWRGRDDGWCSGLLLNGATAASVHIFVKILTAAVMFGDPIADIRLLIIGWIPKTENLVRCHVEILFTLLGYLPLPAHNALQI